MWTNGVLDSLVRQEMNVGRGASRALLAMCQSIATMTGMAPAVLFSLVSAKYERGSIILTSNKGFAEWEEICRRYRDRHCHP